MDSIGKGKFENNLVWDITFKLKEGFYDKTNLMVLNNFKNILNQFILTYSL